MDSIGGFDEKNNFASRQNFPRREFDSLDGFDGKKIPPRNIWSPRFQIPL
jgi:hypothetical protein